MIGPLTVALDLAGPVVEVVAGARHLPQHAVAVRDDLARIGIFADLRRHHGADREIGERGIGIVDDLVGGFRATGRAADDVAGTDLPRLAAVAQRAGALHDEEHLFLGAVAVERARALARRDNIVRIAERLRAQQRPDAHGIGRERPALLEMLELELVEVDDPGLDNAHRSISPKTMSCVPMIATTSAIMCPRDISSSAARCGKPAARSLSRYGLFAPSEMTYTPNSPFGCSTAA